MRKWFVALFALLLLTDPMTARAQVGAQAEADPGVRPTRLIDRAEIRVSRVEIQPGAVRRVHAHDDVVYHLWVPLEGTLEITVGTAAPVAARAGQAFFMVRGTQHGFRNTGTTPGAAMEIFIKQTTVASLPLPDDVQALLAAASIGR